MYITTNGWPNKLWTNNWAGVFTTSVIAANDTWNSVWSVMWDLNGDGFLDIHVVRWGNVNNVIWMSNGTGWFTRQLISGDLNEFPYYNLMWDVNGDGFLDIYVITDASSIPARQNNLRINNWSGWFTKSNITWDAFKSRWWSMWDVDGDGDLDIHVAQTPNAQNFLRINNWSGIFTSNNIPGDILSSYGSQMWDLDGDGDLDIYVTNLSQQRKIWLNNGLGSFTVRDTTWDNVWTTIYSSFMRYRWWWRSRHPCNRLMRSKQTLD
jgi:hypothetical protein